MNNDIRDLQALRRDIARIKKIEDKVANLKSDRVVDKLSFGFNKDDRFKGNTEFNIFLGGYYGHYGSSSVTSIFEVSCKKEFKEALIETLNDLRPIILSKVADKMKKQLDKRSDEILKEIESLQQLYNFCKDENEND